MIQGFDVAVSGKAITLLSEEKDFTTGIVECETRQVKIFPDKASQNEKAV